MAIILRFTNERMWEGYDQRGRAVRLSPGEVSCITKFRPLLAGKRYDRISELVYEFRDTKGAKRRHIVLVTPEGLWPPEETPVATRSTNERAFEDPNLIYVGAQPLRFRYLAPTGEAVKSESESEWTLRIVRAEQGLLVKLRVFDRATQQFLSIFYELDLTTYFWRPACNVIEDGELEETNRVYIDEDAFSPLTRTEPSPIHVEG